ncbi:MAG TPA: ComEC/Rec2 family competence protein [Blastocatellia bacterium]|nr:ComEC/Rec2 family competence protein [Blastocatellia bacterium]
MPRRLSFTRLSLFQQPLVFIAASFILGLLFAARFRFSIHVWMIPSITLWLTALVCLLMKRGGRVVTCLLLILSFVCGGALWALNEAGVGEDRVRRLFDRGELTVEEPVEVWGTLNDAPELAPDRIYLSVAVEKVATLGKERAATGVAQLVTPLKDDQSRDEYDQLSLDYGSRVRILGNLSDRIGYRNPGAPDFDQMLEYRGVDATGAIKSPLLIENLGFGARNTVLHLLYRIRARAIAITLRTLNQPTSGILVAALFGNRHFLSRDAAETFRAGGTFHLLVISGSHVAMIALVALWLVRKLSSHRIIQYSLVMMLMWAYALMVGAQPSITRAVVMLNVALVGQLIFRDSIGANTLAASAIVLLAWQPRDIFNPAFQLSFLTVLMIVALASPLYLRLKKIGEWRPSISTPYPPRVSKPVKWLAEFLFWNEREFREEMKRSPIRYRLEKSRAAVWLNRFRLQGVASWIVITLATTTAAQMGLLPLMIHHFHRFSVVSPVANVVEAALISLLMIAGAAYLMIHSIIGAWALKLAPVVNAIGWLTVEAGKPMIEWRKASFRAPDFGDHWELVFAAYFGAVLTLIIAATEWNPFRKGDGIEDALRKMIGRAATAVSTLTIIALGWLLVVHPFEHKYERGRLSVTFLDVGQGDAMLISFPRGRLMLLDSGGRIGFDSRGGHEENEEVFVEDRIGVGEAAVAPYLWRRGIKRLDWIAASHGDADHVEGFGEIVRGFEIGGALKGVSKRGYSSQGAFDRASLSANAPLRSLKRGDVIDVDGARVEVLSPFADQPPMSDNNESLVLRITLGNRSFLLTGDIEKEAEARLVKSKTDLRADVLKVAHHGSKTSSTIEFVERAQPQHAVISVAEHSPFGHPHAEALARLQTTKARIWRTSECGAITISTDGSDLRVETFVKCESDVRSGDKASRISRISGTAYFFFMKMELMII